MLNHADAACRTAGLGTLRLLTNQKFESNIAYYAKRGFMHERQVAVHGRNHGTYGQASRLKTDVQSRMLQVWRLAMRIFAFLPLRKPVTVNSCFLRTMVW